jgi:methionyl-tRNA synthetase
VLHLCSTDPHQNWTMGRAQGLGEPPEEMIERFGQRIHKAMELARFEYDVFFNPATDDDYRAAIPALLSELVASGAVAETETDLLVCSECERTLHHWRVMGTCPTCGSGACGGTCEGCGSYLQAKDLREATSRCHGAAPKKISALVPVLRLEDFRETLTTLWARAAISPSARAMLGRYLAAGLPEMPLAYPGDWGLPWRGAGEELRIDVWAEMPIAYLYTVARHLESSPESSPATLADCAAAWERVGECWYFTGVDNPIYLMTLMPAIFAAAGVSPERYAGVVVNEFYLLDGQKFSTSRDHAIWGDEFLAEEDPGVVRAYLAWDAPNNSETDFTLAGFQAFKERFTALLDGAADGGLPTGSPLITAETSRGERALRPATFDPALAVRCAMAAYPSGDEAAKRLLACVTGDSL